MDKLEGKVAVVTGAASGIGFALASCFAGEGMKIVIADVESEALEAARGHLSAKGAEVHAVTCDVSDPASVDALRAETLSRFGAAHVVCNNAGVAGGGLSWEIPLATWEWVLGVNLLGVVNGIRSFVPLLLEQGEGHLVNTASAAGLLTMPYMGPYSASKHAVVAITEGLAMELQLAGGKVGVSVLCPMWVRTRIAESERNAPSGVQSSRALSGSGRQVEQEDGLRGAVAGLVAGGMDPGEVALYVRDAIISDRFWILPHDDVRESQLARANRIAALEPPLFAAG
jgi:NAD(P)-dependent dehydrogenase (short-subunit alcohol dehydrogenase family)